MRDSNCCSYRNDGEQLQMERGSDCEWKEGGLTDDYEEDHNMSMLMHKAV